MRCILELMNVRICPQCHSLEVHRSRRRGFVERFLLAFVFKRPFRCDSCKTRYYGYVYSTPLPAEYAASKPKAQAAAEGAQPRSQQVAEESAAVSQR